MCVCLSVCLPGLLCLLLLLHPPPHIWAAAAYFFLHGCDTPSHGTFLPGLCQTPPQGEGGGLILAGEPQAGCLTPPICPPPKRREGSPGTTKSRSPRGWGKETRSLPMMGKGNWIPSGWGRGCSCGHRGLLSRVCQGLPCPSPKTPARAHQCHPWLCHAQTKGLGDPRTEVSQEHSRCWSQAGAEPPPTLPAASAQWQHWDGQAPSVPPSSHWKKYHLFRRKRFIIFFFPKKKSNINIRV